MPIPKTGKGISSHMFLFVLFMTSVIDIVTVFPKVICGSNCIPVTFSCHICDKLQSTEFKNMFPDYTGNVHRVNTGKMKGISMCYIWTPCVLAVVDVNRSLSLQSASSTIPGLRNHWPTGQDAPDYWLASCCLKGWIVVGCRLNGNINLSLSLLTSLLHFMKRVGM